MDVVTAESCPFCDDGPLSEPVIAREMMLGLRESFVYHRCRTCRSLWLAEVPSDIGRYYPEGYYSRRSGEVTLARYARVRTAVLMRLPKSLTWRLRGRRGVSHYVPWLAGEGIRPDHRIADIGSGEGTLLRSLARDGFTDLWGFDPFIESERDAGPIHLRKAGIDAVPPGFDLIMFHHSLEHVPGPLPALRQAIEKLRAGGILMVRLPIAGTHADRTFGPNWVALDPPRHLAIPSEPGMRRLIERGGGRLRRIFYDSSAFQFWGSHQYEHDIPLNDPRSVARGSREFVSAQQIVAWERDSRQLNRVHDGDCAGFIITRA